MKATFSPKRNERVLVLACIHASGFVRPHIKATTFGRGAPLFRNVLGNAPKHAGLTVMFNAGMC